jgi:dipeptidase
MAENHLDLTVRRGGSDSVFNPREAFGSASDSDHVYNTPRAWSMQRYLNPRTCVWDGADADYTPESDDIPWSQRPERLVTIEDVKHVLSLHYQGTPYDCYGGKGTAESRKRYRPIGINRNSQLAVLQLRPYAPAGCRAVQWMALGSNAFNALVALYPSVDTMPAYLTYTPENVSTESFYWANRLIAALADAQYGATVADVERYQMKIGSLGHAMLAKTDKLVAETAPGNAEALLAEANEQLVSDVRRETEALLAKVLFAASMGMRNAFARSDG